MKPKFYEVLDMAIDHGVASGLRRAWKHHPGGPSEEELGRIKEAVYDAVMNSLHEWFDITDPAEWEEE